MTSLQELKYDILASLYYKGATIDELMDRDFLKTTSQYGVERMLMSLDVCGYIYYRGLEDRMFAYKAKSRDVLNENGYEVG